MAALEIAAGSSGNGQASGKTANSVEWSEYGVDLWGALANLVASHKGIDVVLRELTQNADDAQPHDVGDRRLCFDFQDDALVCFNDSRFCEKDFQAIARIGFGGKREDENTGGAFGVGFVSVYQLTDQPEIRSGETSLTVHPADHKVARARLSDEVDGTEIVLRYRRADSEFSQHLRQEAIKDSYISDFLDTARVEIYRHLLFLRRVGRIEIRLSGELLYSVTKRRERELPIADNACPHREEHWHFQAEDRRSREPVHFEHEWIVFGRDVEREAPAGKRREVRLAFCRSSDALALQLTSDGQICVLLPTEARTSAGFFVEADFLPSGDRKSIIAAGNDQSGWNQALLDTAAALFVDVVPRLAELAGSDTAWFYRQLPTGLGDTSLQPHVSMFATRLKEHAPELPIVKRAGSGWVKPREGLHAYEELLAFAGDHVDGLVEGVPREILGFLKQCGLGSWTVRELLAEIANRVPPGTVLDIADPLLRGKGRLRSLYGLLKGFSVERDDDRMTIGRVPIVLAHDGTLWPPADESSAPVYRADYEVRRVLEGTSVRFIDADWQHQYDGLLRGWGVAEAGVDTVLAVLRGVTEDCAGQQVDLAPAPLSGLSRLKLLFDYLAQNLTMPTDVSDLAIFPDEQSILHRGDDIFLPDPDSRRLFGESVPFLAAHFAPISTGQRLSRLVRTVFGIDIPRGERLLSLVAANITKGPLRGQSLLRTRGSVKNLYALLHARLRLTDESVRSRLRELPICLTCQDELVAGVAGTLYLRPEGVGDGLCALVPLANLIHEEVLTPEGEDLLKRGVGLANMSSLDFIKDGILSQWGSVRDADRPLLLRFIRLYAGAVLQDAAARAVLSRTAIISCANGPARWLSEVYFPSDREAADELRGVLGEYPSPDPANELQVMSSTERPTWSKKL